MKEDTTKTNSNKKSILDEYSLIHFPNGANINRQDQVSAVRKGK